jgi:predicted GNAT family N-acyltransferase
LRGREGLRPPFFASGEAISLGDNRRVTSEIAVRRVPVEVTLLLRQQVLRPHETLDQLRLAGDDDPDTAHFAAFDAGGLVVGTASVRREAPPWSQAETGAWRLRGMATAESRRGDGIGTEVMHAVVKHVADHGGGLLWCNARLPALSFYQRAGFASRGEAWDEAHIGPHIAMQRGVS